jgi:hypothetical protein
VLQSEVRSADGIVSFSESILLVPTLLENHYIRAWLSADILPADPKASSDSDWKLARNMDNSKQAQP